MKQELISVIVPVYNTEKYLPRCLQSLVQQTYQNLEILLIDDGSTDSSAEICRKYAKEDARINLWQKENGGQASARNLGLNRMRGEYVLFVDSDDYVSLDYVETLYRQIRREPGIGIAVSGYQKIWEGKDIGQTEVTMAGGENRDGYRIYSSAEALRLLLYQKVFTHSPWPKLFVRSIFDEIRFPENLGYEDLAITYKTFAAAGKISFGSQIGYYYLQRKGSTMRMSFQPKKLDRLEISWEILAFVKENYPQLVKAGEARVFLSALQQLMNLPEKKGYQELYRDTFSVIRSYRSRILRDREAKKSLRLMALGSYLGVTILKGLGNGYDRLVNRN